MISIDKKKLRLARVVAGGALFVAAFITDRFVEIPFGLRLGIFLFLYALVGYDVVYKAVRGIIHGQMLDENFLMTVATAGAFVIGEYPEAVAVMLFYQIGELFQGYAVGKSRASIAALMAISPDEAVVVRGGEEVTVLPEEVEVGEEVVVRPGERVPVDGTVISGSGELDLSALTGESVPVPVEAGAEIMSSSINLSGVLHIRCRLVYGESTVGRILELTENAASKKAKAENFITRFAMIYTPVVVGLAVLLAVLPPLFLGMHEAKVWSDWVGRALTFLVVSCPCALVISVPLSFFGAIGAASRQGILVKGGAALETLDKTDVFLFDKTGTITEGGFSVTGVFPADNRKEVLAAAAIAEANSLHPLARAVMKAYASECGGDDPSAGYEITERAGLGVVAVRDVDVVAVGSGRLLESLGIEFPAFTGDATTVLVARGGRYLGRIEAGSEIKPDSAAAVRALRESGAKCYMLTGDKASVAEKVAGAVGLDGFEAGLLPADKVAATEKYLGRKKKTAFVGDGINDAPVLARVDLGVAMGGVGSDSAIEAADIVVMNDSLAALPKAKKIAKKTMRIVRENIVFALVVKAASLVLGALGLAGMWLAIFADVGVTVLAVLNSMRMLAPSRDKEKQ